MTGSNFEFGGWTVFGLTRCSETRQVRPREWSTVRGVPARADSGGTGTAGGRPGEGAAPEETGWQGGRVNVGEKEK